MARGETYQEMILKVSMSIGGSEVVRGGKKTNTIQIHVFFSIFKKKLGIFLHQILG